MTAPQKMVYDTIGTKKERAQGESPRAFSFARTVKKMYYGKKADPFYTSKAWRAARKAALDRDHYQCQDHLARRQAGARIRVPTATVVHHIKPRELYPELALELSNLVSLCEACHNARHPEKGGSAESRAASAAGPLPVRVIKV